MTNADGTKTASEVEGSTPIAVDSRARDGSNRVSGRDITLSDGRKVFLSGSAPPQP